MDLIELADAFILQLRKLVETGVSPQELRQILVQLRNLAKSALPPPIARPPRPPVAPYFNPQPSFPSHLAQAPPPRLYPQPPLPIKTESVPILSSQSLTVPPPPANIASLFSSLVNAGLLPATTTPAPAAPSSSAFQTDGLPAESTEDSKESTNAAIRDYRDSILSSPINLTTADLSKYVFPPSSFDSYSQYHLYCRAKPRVVEYLYERQGAQCRQCGLRFPDTKLGKKDLENHLDMHFRQNSKVDSGRGHSRSWYIPLDVRSFLPLGNA